MTGKWMSRWKTKKNNKGAAMIMVIVSIAFIGMLVAMIVYMAYCNYMMKAADKVAKNNFYSAESVLDAINAGIQQEVSNSMSEAYVETMQNSLNQTADEMSETFQKDFFVYLRSKLATSATKTIVPTSEVTTSAVKWDTDLLIKYATDAKYGGFKKAAAQGAEGAYIAPSSGNGNILTLKDKQYLTLHNIRVVYTDEKGYVSIIETDIRVKVPDLNYAVASSRLDVENYSIIANNSLTNDSKKGGGSDKATVTGSVYGGKDGIYVANQKSLSFVDSTTDSVSDYYLIAGSLNVENAPNGLTIDSSHQNYVENINVTTSSLNLDGMSYVKDDLTVDGSGSKVKVSGTYRGYGDSLNGADGSSSIIVNGARTSLDFSGLSELLLSGHAFIGASHYDADEARHNAGAGTVDPKTNKSVDYIADKKEYEEKTSKYQEQVSGNSVKKNTEDIMMGESVSVKANQMIYMVPAECMSNGKNPMTYQEYEDLTKPATSPTGTNTGTATDAAQTGTTADSTQPAASTTPVVDLSKLWEKLGSAYTSGYKTVYRRVSGSVLVYFYLDFGTNEMQANEFFKAYYAYDKAGLTNYVKSYITSLTWNDSIPNDKLTLAGNAIKFEGNEVTLKEDNLLSDEKKLSDALTNAEEYENTYLALSCMLKPNIDETSSAQQGQSVYDNIVSSDFVDKNGEKLYKDDADTVNAVVTNKDYTYTGDNKKIKLIISSKDVYLSNSFDGLVIAGGNVYIGTACTSVTYNPVAVLNALRAKYMDGTTTLYAYEALGDSGKLTYAETTEIAGKEYVDLGSLITYENWKKE